MRVDGYPEDEAWVPDYGMSKLGAYAQANAWSQKYRKRSLRCGSWALATPLGAFPSTIVLSLMRPSTHDLRDVFFPIFAFLISFLALAIPGLCLALAAAIFAWGKPVGRSPWVIATIGIVLHGSTLFIGCIAIFLP